jgi:hypothetical protein
MDEALLNFHNILSLVCNRRSKNKYHKQRHGSSRHPWRTDTDVAKAGSLYKLAV